MFPAVPYICMYVKDCDTALMFQTSSTLKVLPNLYKTKCPKGIIAPTMVDDF
jgi:hypothetical protein